MSNRPEKCGSCKKTFYKKKTQAFAYAFENELKFNKKTRTYKCPFCPYFVLTTRPLKGNPPEKV